MVPHLISRSADSELWKLVLEEQHEEAFEEVVRRHQSMVCAVAYNACGNVSLSEDIAQETFWTAWRNRRALAQPALLRSWLCGIARRLGQNTGRREARQADSPIALDAHREPAIDEPDPSDAAATREEESLVWQTLEQIPDTYREPLILFYREDQSVAKVAAALEISEDAVKQRLSRGRAMIREQLAEQVERQLRRGRPGRSFTVAVMSGLTSATIGTKTAMAAGAGGVAKAGVGIGSGVVGGLLGGLFGLGGGWLGTWIPAQLAPTKRERELYLRFGRRLLVVSLLFMLVAVSIPFWPWLPRQAAMVGLFVAIIGFQIYVLVESLRVSRIAKQLRADSDPADDPNVSPLKLRVDRIATLYKGRAYRSETSFLGLPLIDINVSDPPSPQTPRIQTFQPKSARGWIAIGDNARGIILAIATNKAVGLVAGGGRALGGWSSGGWACGLV
ncbi:MAG: hypothetical protein ABS79_02845, partial [Planctomycetes bacterium SCN 63-9]